MNDNERKKLTKQQRNKRKIIAVVVEVLIMLILLAGIYMYLKYSKIEHVDIDEEKLDIHKDVAVQEKLKGYTNIAIFGLDNRSNGDYFSGNSDCIMVASINNDTKDVKLVSVYRDTYLGMGEDKYRKVNSAYAYDGPTGAIAALNRNLDLDIKDYVAVDFNAVSKVIDELGGIELEFTAEEAEKTQFYIDEMNEVLGTRLRYIPGAGTYLCDGVQATAYSRLRYTAGDDFKRTERQRTVVSKIVEKTKTAGIMTINNIIDVVFPDISTNLTLSEIMGMASTMLDYELVDTQGWPFMLATGSVGKSGDAVVTTDLKTNVSLLHEYLFEEENYKPTATVLEIDRYIIDASGMGTDDTMIDKNPLKEEGI